MTTFDKREQGFEQKFAHDADLKFKAEARRNKALAEWAGAKMGMSGAELEDYIKAVRKADLAEKGDEDVFGKVKADFAAKGIISKYGVPDRVVFVDVLPKTSVGKLDKKVMRAQYTVE